ncbi:Mobile element protein [hydrothermal vent metagenome]|uniref:Mobile element protein n=1 Tax=hydrothermal vent metagenome TaxID=652676 RepID=A0A1W1C323_9ZZZZ
MKTMILTQKNRLKLSSTKLEIVKQLAYYSARLYNVALYSVRQYYFNNNAYLNYAKNYHECKGNENYKLLLSDTSQQILRIVDRNFKSFFGLLKLKSQGKYTEKIRIPHYKKEDELMNITIQGRSARIRKGYVIIGLSKAFREKHQPPFKELKFKLPKNITVDKLQEVRILPVFNGLEFDIEFVYKKEFEPISVDKNNYLSIDMGLDNFATCYDSNDGSSFIIDGRYIKSINRHYNKQKAYYQSILDRQNIKVSKKMLNLSRKRYNKINNYFNLAVKYITDYTISKNIGSIVIGDFSDIKQNINIGKKNNQNFVNIPYGIFKRKLQSKCEQLGIEYNLQEESYSSKCSFLDKEPIKKHDTYKGKRVKRGLFRTSQGYLINADTNGAANILVKFLTSNGQLQHLVIANRYGCVNHPPRLKLNDLVA